MGVLNLFLQKMNVLIPMHNEWWRPDHYFIWGTLGDYCFTFKEISFHMREIEKERKRVAQLLFMFWSINNKYPKPLLTQWCQEKIDREPRIQSKSNGERSRLGCEALPLGYISPCMSGCASFISALWSRMWRLSRQLKGIGLHRTCPPFLIQLEAHPHQCKDKSKPDNCKLQVSRNEGQSEKGRSEACDLWFLITLGIA